MTALAILAAIIASAAWFAFASFRLGADNDTPDELAQRMLRGDCRGADVMASHGLENKP